MFKLKKNLTEENIKAKQECVNNDKITHVKKIRALAHEYISTNKADSTPEIKLDSHMSVRFHKGESDTPESVYITVNGKSYAGTEMDAIICKLDRIGPEYKNDKKKDERNDSIKTKGRQIARVVQVDLVHKTVNLPMKSAAEGNSLLTSLLRLLGRTIKHSVQINR